MILFIIFCTFLLECFSNNTLNINYDGKPNEAMKTRQADKIAISQSAN